MEKVFPKLHKKAVDGFEHTSKNMLRSIAMYHTKGIMGKVKYSAVDRAPTKHLFDTNEEAYVYDSW